VSGTRVVRDVLFELKAKNDQLEAALLKAQGSLARTRQAAEGSGAAAEITGKQYQGAAMKVAGAAEALASAGTVTGSSAKKMVTAGASIATMFGPAGVAIGALSFFSIAVAGSMSKARREAEETAEAFEETIARLQNAGDVGALKAEARRLDVGTRAKDFEDGIRRRRERIAQMEIDLEDPSKTNPFNVLTRIKQLNDERAALEPLAKQYDLVAKAIKQFREDPSRVNAAQDFVITALSPEAEERARQKAADAGDKAGDDWGEAFAKAVLTSLGTSAEIAAAEINALIEQGIKVGADPAKIAQLKRLSAQAYTAAEGVAELRQAWMDYESGKTAVGGSAIEAGANALLALQSALARADARLAKLAKGSKDYNDLLKERHDLEQRIKRTLSGDDTDPKPEKLKDAAKETALQLQQAADGALQLAQNLFGAEAGAIGTLRAVSQIAGNIGALKTAFGEGGSLLGKVSGVIGILGAVSSLLRDPEDAARQRAIDENTAALKKLTERAGLLGVGVSGAAAARSASGLAAFLSNARFNVITAGGDIYDATDQARVAAKAFGLDIEELEAIAKEYGIELNGNVESFRQLYDAIQDTITKLGEFGTDLESQRRQADAYARVFGVTDPGELLGLTRGTYGGRSPALDAALGGLDLSTPEGRQAAREALQGLFTTLMAGGGTLSAGQLGGLTGEDLLQAILDLIDGLNAVDESLDTSGVTAEKGDRVIRASDTQITADQASRLLGIQTSMLSEVRIIREALLASRTPMPVPALSAGFSQPMGGGGITVNISQEFYGQTSPRDVARATTDALVEAIDRGLGRRILIQKRHVGDAVSS
jgi:hypothetical protein